MSRLSQKRRRRKKKRKLAFENWQRETAVVYVAQGIYWRSKREGLESSVVEKWTQHAQQLQAVSQRQFLTLLRPQAGGSPVNLSMFLCAALEKKCLNGNSAFTLCFTGGLVKETHATLGQKVSWDPFLMMMLDWPHHTHDTLLTRTV